MDKINKKDIVIVGAGIAGLTAAYLLSKKDHKITIVEKESEAGGLARSFKYDGHTFDIGPHRFHTDDEEVKNFIQEILGDNLKCIRRKSAAYVFDRYYDWPLQIKNITKFPLTTSLKIARDFFIRKNNQNNNFRDYIISRYGKTIFKIFFKPYTEKFLKDPLSKVHSDWARVGIEHAIIDRRIKMGNLKELIKTTLASGNGRISFFYPQEGGIGAFTREIANRLKAQGATILLNKKVDKIEQGIDKIDGLIVDNTSLKPDLLIWTAPIIELARLLNIKTNNLTYLSLICYNLELDSILQDGYQWCYYGDSTISFSRSSIPSLFRNSSLHNGKSGICVEVPCFKTDSIWQNPNSLVEIIKKDLIKIGLVKKQENIKAIHIEKISDSYPIYDLDYKQKINKIKAELIVFENLILLGRSGTFWYNNMDDSIKMAIELAKKLGVDLGN